MSIVFEKTRIKGLVLRNRLVRSATWEGMCGTDGRPTEKLTELYRGLAEGGVGLLITGYTFVSPEGRQMPGKMGVHTDDFGKEMRVLTGTVHGAGGAVAMQLVHAGGQTTTAAAGRTPLAPSAVKAAQYPEEPAEMTLEEIVRTIEAFGRGAARARDWGFDAVQIHGAHGYLVSQFLSPLTNRRKDGYGGTPEKRMRFLLELYEAVRGAVGEDFPVLLKLNGSDFLEGGLEIGEAAAVAERLSGMGLDALEVSGGTPASGERSPARTKIDAPEKEAYHRDLAAAIKARVRCPVMVVGGFRSFDRVEGVLAGGAADYVSMARPLIREPDLPRRWLEGDRSPARCISCNGCFKPGIKEGGIHCVVEKLEEEGRRFSI